MLTRVSNITDSRILLPIVFWVRWFTLAPFHSLNSFVWEPIQLFPFPPHIDLVLLPESSKKLCLPFSSLFVGSSHFFLLISAFSTYENNALMHESKPRPPQKIMRGLAGSHGFAVAGSVPRRRAGIDWMSSLKKKKLGRATSWRKIKDLKIKFVVSLFFPEYTWRRGNVPSGR